MDFPDVGTPAMAIKRHAVEGKLERKVFEDDGAHVQHSHAELID